MEHSGNSNRTVEIVMNNDHNGIKLTISDLLHCQGSPEDHMLCCSGVLYLLNYG